MIQLILIAAGIFILAKGRIDVSSKKILVRPKSAYVAIILVISGLSMNYIKMDGASAVFLFLVLVATVVTSYFLAEDKNGNFLKTDKK
jgi:hypothetical protein